MTPSKATKFAAGNSADLASEIVAVWHDLARALFDSYRPERHYMRGPGPAWRAKHGTSVRAFTMAGAEPVGLRPIPALVRVRR
jgi:hypothetical protein